jgi:hypothetical protein
MMFESLGTVCGGFFRVGLVHWKKIYAKVTIECPAPRADEPPQGMTPTEARVLSAILLAAADAAEAKDRAWQREGGL